MVIARSVPISFIFGSAQVGGLGITHLAAGQGHTRLQYLLGHLRCGDATGCLMQMILEYTQLECGCRGNPLAQDYNNYSALLINTNWITGVWTRHDAMNIGRLRLQRELHSYDEPNLCTYVVDVNERTRYMEQCASTK
jgi:hypothetical protein